MSKLRNRFKRLAFNGFLTRCDGSGSAATWWGHLLSAEQCLHNLSVLQCECVGMCRRSHSAGDSVAVSVNEISKR